MAAPAGVLATPLHGPAGVFKIPSGRRLTAFLRVPGIEARGPVITRDGRTAAMAAEDGVRLWNAATGRPLYRLPGAEVPADFSPRGDA